MPNFLLPKFLLMYLMGFGILLGSGLVTEPKSVQSAIFVLLANVWFVGAHICDSIDARSRAAAETATTSPAGGDNG